MKEIALEDLQHIVKSDDVVAMAALSVSNLPAELLRGLIISHEKYKKMNALTFILANDINSYGDTLDLDDFVERHMIKRLITSILTGSKKTATAMKNNEIEAYFLPQGVIATHYRYSTRLTPGLITKIGLNTNIDPRYKGGKVNAITKKDIVSLRKINGEDYLQYNFPKIDIALLRGTYADINGNIYASHEAHLGEGYSVALAAKQNGGKVIVQVKEIIELGKFQPSEVFIPGELVDYVFKSTDKNYHKQVIQTYYDPAISSEYRVQEMPESYIEFGVRKIILRKSTEFLKKDDVISIGFGINNELTNLLVEEEVHHLVHPILDIGIFGGYIGSRENFGMNYNTEAKLRQDMTWDFIYNGGVDIAYMSFAEFDQHGNVNVSFFSDRMNGSGGFVDISQSVKNIIFSGTLVAGAKITCEDEKLVIQKEGHTKKGVTHVQNIDFNAEYANYLHQNVFYVTERAVFRLVKEGLLLIEIAPGLDLKTDILDQLDFEPLISEKLKTMDPNIFKTHWGKLKEILK